ncbi:hypothetical protein BT69DRAFT_1277891 [Atractiella rhizophila]|nr:hypothetical protein BT69DRAFT_1277891 [Atractiella rhizophila]
MHHNCPMIDQALSTAEPDIPAFSKLPTMGLNIIAIVVHSFVRSDGTWLSVSAM